MSYCIERLNDHVLCIFFNADFRSGAEMVVVAGELMTLVEEMPAPIHLIFNVEQAAFSVEDVIHAANLARRDEISLFGHPKVGKQAVISTNKLIQLSAKGLNSASFGNLSLPVFATLEEAVEYVFD